MANRASVPVGRFHLDLDVVKEEGNQILFDVQEKNDEYLEGKSIAPFYFDKLSEKYAKDDGFPEVLDLSRYFLPGADGDVTKVPKKETSIFGAEFDRLCGRIDENEGCSSASLQEQNLCNDDIDAENERRIANLSTHEIRKAQQEIFERFDLKLVDFLRNRGRNKAAVTKKEDSGKKSLFKKSRSLNVRVAEENAENQTEKMEPSVQEKVKQLEVFGTGLDGLGEASVGTDKAPYTRLAADAVQLDFISKCFRTLVPRQQQNVVRLFDGLQKGTSTDSLLELARSNLPAIKGLYLDEVKTGKGEVVYQFANGINPIEQSCWTLCPIRKVLDVCEKDGKVAVEDVVVVRLSLLWTVLLMTERLSIFHAFTSPVDLYIRLAEVFLINPEVFMDDCVRTCTERILKRYLIPKATDRLLTIKLAEPVADLDAFLPFYEDLLKHYEEDGMGDELFSLMILIGAYMNSHLPDGLLMKCAIWTSQRQLSRMIIADSRQALSVCLIKFIAETREEDSDELESDSYAQYSQLLAMYAKAIRDGIVSRERNSLMFEIAASELGHFVGRHSERVKNLKDQEHGRLKEMDLFVDILRRTVTGKLNL